jgi:HD-like signal output (HDOD) protein/CheY-like chemotaxis protein
MQLQRATEDGPVFILVVSDDGGHAAQIEDELKDQGLDWRIAWTDRAEVALTGEWDPDVLVCASRVGSSHGRTLLGQLRKRHPDAVRILLMDSSSDEDAMEALEVSHRVLPEPLEALALIEAVESVIELRTLLSDQSLKTAIGRLGSLPAAPRQYLALTRLLRDPETSSARVVEAVAKDPAVAAKVLRLTNSAYYSGGREISDLRTAVTRLGQNALLQLVLANEVFSAGASSADADAMRDRSLRISQLAGRLLAGPSAELASTAGLLAEVGLLLPPMPSGDGDGTVTPHGVAGAYLLGLWGLPSPIVEAVAFHQNPARLRGGFWVAGAVHVAAAIVNGTYVDEGYLRTVGQLDRLPRWRSLAEEMAEAA